MNCLIEAGYKPKLVGEPLVCSYRIAMTNGLNGSSAEEFEKCTDKADSMVNKKYDVEERKRSDQKARVSVVLVVLW